MIRGSPKQNTAQCSAAAPQKHDGKPFFASLWNKTRAEEFVHSHSRHLSCPSSGELPGKLASAGGAVAVAMPKEAVGCRATVWGHRLQDLKGSHPQLLHL